MRRAGLLVASLVFTVSCSEKAKPPAPGPAPAPAPTAPKAPPAAPSTAWPADAECGADAPFDCWLAKDGPTLLNLGDAELAKYKKTNGDGGDLVRALSAFSAACELGTAKGCDKALVVIEQPCARFGANPVSWAWAYKAPKRLGGYLDSLGVARCPSLPSTGCRGLVGATGCDGCFLRCARAFPDPSAR